MVSNGCRDFIVDIDRTQQFSFSVRWVFGERIEARSSNLLWRFRGKHVAKSKDFFTILRAWSTVPVYFLEHFAVSMVMVGNIRSKSQRL